MGGLKHGLSNPLNNYALMKVHLWKSLGWDARTRQNAYRTHVRRGDLRGMRPAFFFISWLSLTRVDSGLIGRNRQFRPKFKKKKKRRCKTQHLNSITNPKLFHAFFTSNFSSLSLVFVLSTSLSLLSVSVVRHSATQSHKQSHSQLTYNLTNPLSISSSKLNSSLNSQAWPTLKSLNSGIKLKLSILVFQFF